MSKGKILSYLKFCLFPRKQAGKILRTIIIPHLFLFVIIGFGHLLNNEVFLASQMYDQNTIYEQKSDFSSFDELISYAENQKKILGKTKTIESEGILIQGQTHYNTSVGSYLFPTKYLIGDNNFDYLYAEASSDITYDTLENENTLILSEYLAQKFFGTTECLGTKVFLTLEGSKQRYEFIVARIVKPSYNSKTVFGTATNQNGDEIIIAQFNEVNIKDLEYSLFSKNSTFAYQLDSISSSDISLFKTIFDDFYCNELEYQTFTYSYGYFFDLIDKISYIAISLCIINLVLLVAIKSQLIKSDMQLRRIFFEDKKQMLIGYCSGFSMIFLMGIGIAFVTYLLLETIIYFIFQDFYVFDLSIFILLILEIIFFNVLLFLYEIRVSRRR